MAADSAWVKEVGVEAVGVVVSVAMVSVFIKTDGVGASLFGRGGHRCSVGVVRISGRVGEESFQGVRVVIGSASFDVPGVS